MNKFYGNFFKYAGTALDYLLEFFIAVFSLLTELSRSFRSLLLSVLFFGGCLFFFIFLIPMSYSSRRGFPWGSIVLLILVFPIIGSFAVSRLKYLQYMVTEYFYERADYYLLGKNVTYDTMGDYGRRYRRKIEEERRRREEEEARREEELFRRQFEAFFNQGNFTGNGGGYGDFGQGGYSGGQWGYDPPGAYDGGFKEKYEAAARRLGVDVTADKYEIRLAYKKLAKKYHPDLNPQEDTTKIFQEINAANDFLTDEAIARYKSTYGRQQ
ncbi:MAG: J domain-containing protein [Peptoniphilus sp.]|nr:J domain-containing protein [Peptoniphilus sp.]MDY3119024.1 J domain-containing protein [Peptoniphilus sp.]